MASQDEIGRSDLLNAMRMGALVLGPLVRNNSIISPGSMSVLYAKLTLTQFLLAVISRLALDPLKKFPGPLAARITNGYGGFYALKRRLHLETYKNNLKYGTRSHFAVGSKTVD